MSITSPLESNEDLEIEEHVRMEDIQPQKNTVYIEIKGEECFVDNIYYDNECVINDDDSHTESVVFIKSEEVIQYDSDSGEYIVPEVIEPSEGDVAEVMKKQQCASPESNRWPTLEILPGGVIKDAELYQTSKVKKINSKEMMYACAKCTQTYEHLFNLVKHLKWHEEEEKKYRDVIINKVNNKERHVESDRIKEEKEDDSEMIYACAICPRRYKKLLLLVKHVKWHKDLDKKKEDSVGKSCPYHKVLARRKAMSTSRCNNKPKK